MYNEDNENNIVNENDDVNGIGNANMLNNEAAVNNDSIENAQQTYTNDSVYHFTKEQLENQWQPNTGTYFTDNNTSGKKRKEKKVKIKKDKKPIGAGKMFAACTASALVAVIASTGVMYGLYKAEIEDNYMLKSEYAAANIGNTKAELSSIMLDGDDDDNGVYTASQVAQAVLPSVVSITSTAIVQSNYNPFYGGGSYQVTGAGSGIIVGKNDTELLIVTNNHVIEDTTSLTVEFVDGESIDSAYVKGTDSSNDLAIVAIKLSELDEDTMSAIKIAVLGDSDALSVGDGVIAIGNALGYGQSVTQGVVSAINRTITLDSGELNVIQTDASINGGNSGGALVNMKGEVIGINVAKASNSSSSSASVEGMGYAIPVSEVMDIINDLMNKETKVPVSESNQGYLGLTNQDYVEVDVTTSKMYNIPEGIYIRQLQEGTPLEIAGVSAGDVITAINGEEVSTFDELKNEMQYYSVGEEITVTVQVRGEKKYKEKDFTIKLISKEELEEIIE